MLELNARIILYAAVLHLSMTNSSNNLHGILRQEGMPEDLSETPKLAIVVITRNEEDHIADCLAALIVALRNFPTTRVIVVDSCSSDRTVDIARNFPVEIYRYHGPLFSAAAGRTVGFSYTRSEYVLFIDGDCCIEPKWLEQGLSALESAPSAGVVYGQRREVFENATEDAIRAAPKASEYGLGGNGLYKSEVMRLVGGFNPFLPADEEAELLARIKASGFGELAISDLMFTHYTPPKTTIRGYLSRVRRGLARGLGQTLRVSIEQRLLLYHARRLNRYLFALGYLTVGLISAIESTILKNLTFLATWGFLGLVAFGILWLRRRSLRSTLYILADWFTIALFIPADFVRRPKKREEFEPKIERLQ
jgi:glycosyltransferase involved in cell wall biosynthesis